MHSTLLNFLRLLPLLGFYFSTLGQQSVYHPLTSYGIGDGEMYDHAIYSALGNVQSPYMDSTQLNYLNPASYSGLSKGNTLFSVAVNQRVSFFTQNDERLVKATGNLGHIALGFKLKQRFGLAFGLLPFAAKGYDLSERMYTGYDSILNSYSGSGYINRVFCGVSYAPIRTNKSTLSIGANAGYLFGGVQNQRMSQLIQGSTASGGLYQEDLRISAMNLDVGMIFSQRLGERMKWNIGGTYLPGLQLPGTLETVFYSATNLNSPSSYDTLSSATTKGNLLHGERFTASSAFYIFLKDKTRKNKTKHPELCIGLQYTRNTPFTYRFQGTVYDSTARSTRATDLYSLGIEFKPERYLFENIATLGFFDKFTYRLGAYYGSLPYSDNFGNTFKTQALTFGLGIPILSQQSLSSLNFSCTLGQRGTFVAGALQENFMSFQLTAVLAPAGFERWFRKRKMD
ncbi:MAG: hypothetical protein EB023_02615 [Flavobacteriia bacterium]|nr:hypothetical protein [Flavobacteriia bacterium]